MKTKPENTVEATEIPTIALRLIGTPDRRMVPTNGVLLDPESGADATILQATHNLNEGRAVTFQPATGKTTYLEMPGCSGSWAVLPMGGGEAYLGSHMHGYLYHLKPGATTLERVELPRPQENSYDWIWSLDLGSDGNLYLGTYPEGALLRYHPQTGEVEELGALNPDTSRAHYLRSITGQFPGRLYIGAGAEAELLEYELATGKITPLLPRTYKERSFVYHVERVGQWLAAGLSHDDVILLFDPDTNQLVHEIEIPGHRGLWMGNRRSFLQFQGDLYFTTSGDDSLWAWNPEKGKARKMGEGMGRLIGLADNAHFFFMDAFGVCRVVEAQSLKTVIAQPSRFEGAGMALHALSAGPGESVVGGIYINQGYFSYDASGEILFAPGAAISYGGQIDSLATLAGKVYLAHYTSARLSVWNPAHSWNPGLHPKANPRVIGAAGQDQDRYPSAIAGSDGKIYLGSIPDYGKRGGALVIYDPGSDQWTTHRHIVKDQSVYALAEGGEILYGSTAIVGGLGSTPTATEAVVFAWDMEAGEKIWERVVVPGAREIWGLDYLGKGWLIGGADQTLFLLHPASGEVRLQEESLPETITKLLAAQDGWVYGLTQERFFRVSHDLEQIETIQHNADYWDSLAETPGGKLFVGRGAQLFEVVRTT